jgi:hypothetical protein
MNRTKAIVALAATLMSTAAISAPALAEINTFPASMCQPGNFNDAAKLLYRNNSLDNISNNGAIVVCPIPNDVLITKNLAILRVSFTPGFIPSCTLRSFKADSTLLDSSVTAPTSDGRQLVTKAVIPGDLHTLTCALQPGSRIFNYRLVK